MLSRPEYGWTDFSLEKSTYPLSYLTNIPEDWLNHAIHGLETLSPFTVHGFCEPGRLICTVSYWNCHIIFEYDGRRELSEKDACWEISHTDMLEFCKALHRDISENIDQWSGWLPAFDSENPAEEQRSAEERLRSQLEKLGQLIADREECFGERRFFL